jgi:hypothetical protein
VSDVSIVEANRLVSKEAYDHYIRSACPSANATIKKKTSFEEGNMNCVIVRNGGQFVHIASFGRQVT